MKSIFLLLMLLALPLLVACGSTLDVTASDVERKISGMLNPGDSPEKIEVYFEKEGLPFSYDEFSSRYQSIIREANSNHHAIVIHVYVDEDQNFIKVEANDSYTGL